VLPTAKRALTGLGLVALIIGEFPAAPKFATAGSNVQSAQTLPRSNWTGYMLTTAEGYRFNGISASLVVMCGTLRLSRSP
jgi:hypothetical protein